MIATEGSLHIHGASACAPPCPFHGPTDHHMRAWPMNRRESGLIERICPQHGVGHPDPDSLAYWIALGRGYLAIHGCCGCCNPAK
jgi:hypothetical protein